MRERHSQLNLPPLPVHSLSQRRESAAPSEGKEVSLTELLAEVVSANGCAEKEAALAQGYEPTYWSRVKAGEKAAQLDRIARLPKNVQRDFVIRYGQSLGLRVTVEDAQKQAAANLLKAAADYIAEIA